MQKAAKNVNFVVINVSLEQGSPTLFVSEYCKEYALCTQRKINYFMMKYWIERAWIL